MPDYRAYEINPEGHIAGVPTIITCDDDQAAIEKTKTLMHGKDVELWDGPRLIIKITKGVILERPPTWPSQRS